MPVSLQLRPLTPDDFSALDPLLMAAYGRSTSMLDVLTHYHQLQPDGWVLALQDDKPVGTGGAICYGEFARIGLVGVGPGLQGQGIGTAIMQHLLEWCAQRGAGTVMLDATPAGVPLYTKLGFVTDDYVCGFVQDHPSTLMDSPGIAVQPLEPSELPKVVKYDAQRFGASRAVVLASFYAQFSERAFVARNSQGTIMGYIIAQASRVGPWLADSPEAASALLKQVLQLTFSPSPMILVPKCNQEARFLLEQAGFVPEKRWQFMRLHGTPNLWRRQWLYGYASFYVG